jgi:uncharacterized protein YpiB (UPF0302 family)
LEKNLFNISQLVEVNAMYSEFAEGVLNKALRDYQKEQILKEIDQSLQKRNKVEFLRLTEELKNIF